MVEKLSPADLWLIESAKAAEELYNTEFSGEKLGPSEVTCRVGNDSIGGKLHEYLLEVGDILEVTVNQRPPRLPKSASQRFVRAIYREMLATDEQSITIDLTAKGKRIVNIDWIGAMEAKGTGLGSRFLANLCAKADRQNIVLTGEAITRRVAEWLVRFGFTIGDAILVEEGEEPAWYVHRRPGRNSSSPARD